MPLTGLSACSGNCFDEGLVLKLSLPSFAKEHSLHSPMMQFSVWEQENLTAS